MSKIIKKLLKLALAGITATLPIFLTFYFIYYIFNFVDGISNVLIQPIIGRRIFGLGFIVTILAVLFIGLLTQLFVGRKLFNYIESVIKRIPLVNLIFKALHELTNSVVTGNKGSLSKPALVPYPGTGLQSIGFITKEGILVNGVHKNLVFVPTTPNPTNGFLFLVPMDSTINLNMKTEDAMKIVISLGLTIPTEWEDNYSK